MAKQFEIWTMPVAVDLKVSWDPASGDYRVERRFLVRNPSTKEWQIEEVTAWYPLTLESATDVLVLLAKESADAFVISEQPLPWQGVDGSVTGS